MALTLEHFTEDDEKVLRSIADQLLRQEAKTGVIVESNVDARQGGYSIHVKFAKKSSVFATTEAATIMDGSPDKLFLILRKLLDLPDGYKPEEG